jgi:hypothetical protein
MRHLLQESRAEGRPLESRTIWKNRRMVAVAENLSFSEFQSKFENGDRSYEYWHGRATPKGMPTWIHGLLQIIIGEQLREAGFFAGSEVELRIVPDAHPKPSVIATRGKVEGPILPAPSLWSLKFSRPTTPRLT